MLGLREKLFISDALTIRARQNFHGIRQSCHANRRRNFRRVIRRHSIRFRSNAAEAAPNFHSVAKAAQVRHHNSAGSALNFRCMSGASAPGDCIESRQPPVSANPAEAAIPYSLYLRNHCGSAAPVLPGSEAAYSLAR
jgi:hypothetical protein